MKTLYLFFALLAIIKPAKAGDSSPGSEMPDRVTSILQNFSSSLILKFTEAVTNSLPLSIARELISNTKELWFSGNELFSRSAGNEIPEKIKESSNSHFEELIHLETENCRIEGTLLMPAKTVTPIPLVMIIAGSGPTDRDCNSSLLPGKNNTYKLLAQSLADNNIASFRYDKRGVGKSRLINMDYAGLTFSDYVSDAESFINLLKEDKRFSKIIVAGHSEGSLIGILALQQSKADAFISLAGAGRSMANVIIEQVSVQLKGVPLFDTVVYYFEMLNQGLRIDPVNPMLEKLFHRNVQLFLTEVIQYDPAAEISKLELPVLIVHGTNDIQISGKDASLLAESNPSAKMAIIAGMNHVLKNAPSNDISAYSNPNLPVSTELIDIITGFIRIL